MTDAEELSELHRQFVIASTNYVSAVQDTRAAAAKMQEGADAEQLGDWQNKLSREEELHVLYHRAQQKYSEALLRQRSAGK